MEMSFKGKRKAKLDPREVSICVLPNSEVKTVADQKTKKEEYKKEGKEECGEEAPNNQPCAEEEEHPEDGWFCPKCLESPCQFIQWHQELERIVDVMNPDLFNKQKRFQWYQHVSHCRNGPMGKGNRRQLPSCFEGMRDLYLSIEDTGYKTGYGSGPDDGSKNLYMLNRTN
jgi:hypothetical protein